MKQVKNLGYNGMWFPQAAHTSPVAGSNKAKDAQGQIHSSIESSDNSANFGI